MVDLGTYVFEALNTGGEITKGSFTNAYVEEVYRSEILRIETKLLRVILDSKYKKEDLHEVMETQCKHLTVI